MGMEMEMEIKMKVISLIIIRARFHALPFDPGRAPDLEDSVRSQPGVSVLIGHSGSNRYWRIFGYSGRGLGIEQQIYAPI